MITIIQKVVPYAVVLGIAWLVYKLATGDPEITKAFDTLGKRMGEVERARKEEKKKEQKKS